MISNVTAPTPQPALVKRDAVRRLPRVALLLLCAAYVLPGLIGRDPWRGGDMNAFGQMLAIAEGRSPWMHPSLGGIPTDSALLPHWLGALSIMATQSWLDAPVAARLPFALLLVLTMVAVWYACFHLAATDAAQPLPLAFGGEAPRVDYARAVADGALLALIATLGLLQMGHETTPEMAQLAAVAGWQWSLSAAPRRGMWPRCSLLLALPVLAACGAPVVALALGCGALALAWLSADKQHRVLMRWLMAALALAMLVAWPAGSWAWRLSSQWDAAAVARLWLWFLWPGGLLAAWTLWRWRAHLGQWHIAVPASSLALALVASVGMGASEHALLLGLPGAAVLAAFALPTLQRGTTAAIDWFSLFFFTACALAIWVMFIAMQTGVPAQPAANVTKLAPGFVPRGSWLEVSLGLLATAAWVWLVRWRTGRHREALWKSLVLPAGGVALCWLLLMTLWLPLLDFARSNRPLAARLLPYLPAGECVAAPGATQSLVVTLEWLVRRQVAAAANADAGQCRLLVLIQHGAAPSPEFSALTAAGWIETARVQRPTDRLEWTIVMHRGQVKQAK